ncbi:hypothetical protein J5X84_39270 [Streptosporangiaceae bacterium NEAU-GS5]|nr:hypothetical protein [Streptosporangiaceae bacterium NEAU-GS5]
MTRARESGFIRELLGFAALWIVSWWIFAHDALRSDLLQFLAGRRAIIYPAVVSLEATLLGFIVAILTIALGYAQAPRFEIVRNTRHWPSFFGAYVIAMRWAACGTLASVIALLFDRDTNPHVPITLFLLAAFTLSALFTVRMLWLTQGIVRVVTATRSRRPGE